MLSRTSNKLCVHLRPNQEGESERAMALESEDIRCCRFGGIALLKDLLVVSLEAYM
jgi:hypothetical protein